MNELALFAGIGGGLLGSRLLGWRTICAVELDAYCREVLLRRQRDGVLDLCPIWGDVRTFDGRPWRGLVDIVTAGFPCQAFSTASRGRVVAPDLFGEVTRILEEVRPRYILLENVVARAFSWPASASARVHCPAELGAPHRRRRHWLVALTDDEGESAVTEHDSEVAGLPAAARVDWWEEGPGRVLGMDDGAPYRIHRFAAIGNGQVPAVVVEAWRQLSLTC